MKYYIIAGEASGDLHASNLIKSIKNKDNKTEVRGWGGDLMQKQGANIIKHYKYLAFMGFVEVLLNLKTILKNIKFCKKDILKYNPDALILVDYPGFNLKIAKWASKNSIKVFYYISPQLWAWKEGRIKQIKKYVNEMLTILPFEKDFYKKHNYKVHFVGHPLLDSISTDKLKKESFKDFYTKNNLENKPIIAVLPGSRKQEISKILPIMLRTKKYFKKHQFIIVAAPSQDIEFYKSFIKNKEGIFIYQQKNNYYNLLQQSQAAIVTSGTATLEVALFNVPEVVCYKGSKISFWIAKKLVKIKFISLVNLIMNEEIVKELIQNKLTVKNIVKEIKLILPFGAKNNELKQKLQILKTKLGGAGASDRASQIIVDKLKI